MPTIKVFLPPFHLFIFSFLAVSASSQFSSSPLRTPAETVTLSLHCSACCSLSLSVSHSSPSLSTMASAAPAPASSNDSVSLEPKLLKHVRDNVHGNIFLEPIFLKFVDTEQFQRLRDLKQLGLLHDVGHGPFSHTFDSGFLPLVLNGSTWSHEEMSVRMIDHIVDQHNIDIDAELLKKVKEMITSSSDHPSQKENQFFYDIVANHRNGIDVDKFDYIVRDSRGCGLGCNFQPERLMETMQVMDDEICYRAKDYQTIHKLSATRADLHRTVYTHAKVKLDGSILKTIESSSGQELKESRNLILRIRRRDLYQFCNEFSVPKEELDHSRSVTPQDIVCSQTVGITLKEEDVAVSNVKIDLPCGRENPLERIKFFKDYESKENFQMTASVICYQHFTKDIIVRVYSKKPELVETVSAAFENYQLKTFGRKTLPRRNA